MIRFGFVSNSSSSSFLIRIPKNGVIDNYKEYFGINEEDPIKLLEKIVGLGTVVLRALDKDDDYFYDKEILVDPEDIINYYQKYREDDEDFKKMAYELNHPEEFPDTRIIAFEADDNEGNIVDYKLTNSLSDSWELDFTSPNIVVFNEH